ncbi:MAG: ABC transporter permease [Melioribacteraceae bacterium]|nr:ABC transporter permease [Melioribacteraceae bacterium]
MLRKARAIAKKEIKQLVRDTRMMLVIFSFPVILLIVFGYAVNFDVQNIQLAVYDQERSEITRDFINTLTGSSYFTITRHVDGSKEIGDVLSWKEAQAVIVFPLDFSKNFYSAKRPAKVQVIIDGVDGNTASIIKNYVNAAVLTFNQKYRKEILADYGKAFHAAVDLQPIFWFNPDLQTTKFLIPGLIALILIVTAVITVSLTLVREKERGTIEQINVSSINTMELLLGKSIPYLFVALINASFILIAGYLLFDVVVKGSYVLLFFATIIFLFSSTSLGIFISVISDSQQVAFSIATFVSFLPSVILSGFIFPIESMPYLIQLLTNISPAKFFIVVLRAIILRGAGLQAFWDQLLYLLIFSFILLGAASVINMKKPVK